MMPWKELSMAVSAPVNYLFTLVYWFKSQLNYYRTQEHYTSEQKKNEQIWAKQFKKI